jgi:hypothetical protein
MIQIIFLKIEEDEETQEDNNQKKGKDLHHCDDEPKSGGCVCQRFKQFVLYIFLSHQNFYYNNYDLF